MIAFLEISNYVRFLDSLLSRNKLSRQGVKDVLVSSVPQVIGVLTGFVGSIFIARGLGPLELGNYTLILSLTGIVSVFSDFGIGQTAIWFASSAASQGNTPLQMSILRWALRLRLAMVFISSSIIFLLIPFLATNFWHSPELILYFRLGLVAGIFNALAVIPSIYFQSVRQFSANAIITSAQKIILLSGILLLAVFAWWSLANLIVVNIVVSAIAALLFFLMVPRSVYFTPKELRVPNKSLLSFLTCPYDEDQNKLAGKPENFALYQMLLSITLTLSAQVGIWLMGYYLEKSQIGIYSVAARYTLPLAIIGTAINTALWPRTSSCLTKESIKSLMKKVCKLCFFASLIGTIYAFLAPLTIGTIFGKSYSSGVLTAQLLCIRSCVALTSSPIGLVGYCLGMNRYYWFMNFIVLIIVAVVNIILLPKIGILGAAVAFIIGEIILLMMTGALIHRKYRYL